jgi:hypothetical protein
MEKYVFICDSLISKYMDDLTPDVCLAVLQMFKIKDTSKYTRSIWFKMLKILAN